MDIHALHVSVQTVPAGRWGVGVSGGVDSVALLRLLRLRTDLSLHVIHLDHETRDGESALDAAFVANLAAQLGLPCSVARRGEIESTMSKLNPNLSARFRAARMALFKQVTVEQNLAGIVLAHHQDDQAETILQRLARGAGATAVAGMSAEACVSGVRILRPLLNIPGATLRDYLRQLNQPWREDSSNASLKYQRNRVRPVLAGDPLLRESLLELGAAAGQLRDWLADSAPVLPDCFQVHALASLPGPQARHAAAVWLIGRGCPRQDISRDVTDRLIAMATDAAVAHQQHFPGGLLVRRRRGVIFCETN